MMLGLPGWMGGFDWQRELRGLRLFLFHAGDRVECWTLPHQGYATRRRG
jgi:hypothetical protein